MFVRWKKTKLARGGKTKVAKGERWHFAGCHHPHGSSSLRLTFVVVEAYRDDNGKPKQRRVWSPSLSIRQCCVDDRETFERVKFWRNFEAAIDQAISSHPRGDDLLCNRALILWAVSKVVPNPSVDEAIMFEFIRRRIPIPYPQGLNELEKERFEYRECAKAHADWTNNRRNGEGFGAYQQRKTFEADGARYHHNGHCHSPPVFKVDPFDLCWDTLGLVWPCTSDDVRKAYKALALKHHPDRNGGSDEMMKKINQARDKANTYLEQ